MTNSNPKITTEMIGPAEAKEILEHHNAQNRAFKRKSINQYTRAMRQGEWTFIGDPIRFDRGGELLDGQNRLAAVIESGIPQTFVVIRNLEPDSQRYMDSGVKRSPADQLKIEGVAHPNEVAQIAALVMHWKGNDLPGMNIKYSTFEIVEFVEANTNAVEAAATHARALYHATRASKGTSGAVYFMAAEAAGAETASEFFGLLTSGAGLDNGSPVLLLRNKLIYWASTKARSRERAEILYFYVRCWNGWRKNEKLERLQLPRDSRGVVTMGDLRMRG
ncbi:hypothetical protein [Actinophytocola sp.]|uniref:hypothetical protein n=1 Tax=Actinophytocola sp. TaxID=1872138 RepID=UPI002D7E2E91|nr:hypothetical protein [Actinophytocola sp.]HET9144064.1 hypothetical protein [Actinophytocola sp.]